jgi:hypothetical protein
MATFKINPGSMNEKSVTAETFELSNDYWYFFDAKDVTVYVGSAKGVNAIERAGN